MCVEANDRFNFLPDDIADVKVQNEKPIFFDELPEEEQVSIEKYINKQLHMQKAPKKRVASLFKFDDDKEEDDEPDLTASKVADEARFDALRDLMARSIIPASNRVNKKKNADRLRLRKQKAFKKKGSSKKKGKKR